MKDQPHTIQHFRLSPWAKAGIAIKNLQDDTREEDHDSSTPHRDNHYLFMLATHGSLKVNLDFKEIAITAPALLFVFPEQVHHIINAKGLKGWAISFDPSLMDNAWQVILEKHITGPITLDQQTGFYHYATTLMSLIEQLRSEGVSGYGSKTIHSLLDALLGLIAEMVTIQFTSGDRTTTSRAAIIAQSFDQLLKQHYKTWKQPAQYADELNISVAHLYDTIKGITGSSVSTLIQERSILEAKRLLYFTDLSVKEVGYGTGYNEPVYFGKLFKKLTGLTPLQFRQQYRD